MMPGNWWGADLPAPSVPAAAAIPAPAAASSASAPSQDASGWWASDATAPPGATAAPQEQAQQPAAAQLLPIAPYGATDAALHGMTFGISDAADAAAMALARYLRGQTPGFDYSQAAKEVQRGREAYSSEYPWRSAGANITGSLAYGAPIAKSITAAPTVFGQLARGILSGGAIGATQGAADNNATLSSAETGAERGGEGGALIGGGLSALGPAFRAAVPGLSTAAQTLRGFGVNPTPGAAVGGLPGAIENFAGKVPVLGFPIQAGRAAAQHQLADAVEKNATDFNRGAVNEVLGPIGESLNPATATGHDAIAEAAQKAHAAYEAAIPKGDIPVDPQAWNEISQIRANARLVLPPQIVRQFNNFMQANVLRNVTPAGTMSGAAFKSAESDLGKEASRLLGGNSTASEKALGDQYRNVQATLRDWLGRAAPENAPQIQAANQTWARLLPVQDAAATLDGRFTPQQLGASARKFAGRVRFARGNAPMLDYAMNGAFTNQQLSDAAKTALIAPSALSHGGAVGAGVLGAGLIERLMEHPDPRSMAIAGTVYPALSALYSNAGRRVANAALGRSLPSPALLAPFAAQSFGQLAPGQ
jgi:hypothetical protein